MKNAGLLLICLVLFLPSYVSSEDLIKWFSLREGREKAKIEKKPMLVDFYFGKECPRCEALQKGVYDNSSIAKKITEDFIPIRIDLNRKLTDQEEKLGNQYDYKNDCLLLFLNQNGKIIKDPSGKKFCFADNIEPEWFIKYLDMVKEGKTGK